jgi:hypothetical protein
MPQTQSPTTEGYAEMAKLIAVPGGLVTATGLHSVVCLKTTCTADATQTYSGVTKCTETGLTLADADTVTATTDTASITHVFTAAASATVKGFIACNDDNDVAYGICCFNADLPIESADTLTVNMTFQFKLGS